MFWRFGLKGWQNGARGTESRYSWDGTLLPLSHFPGRCTGECHGGRICGRTEDLRMCELCFDLENEERWLCSQCRHTEADVCRNCPAKQRAEGGRQPRDDEPRCAPEEFQKKREKIFRYYKKYMTEEAFEDADYATRWAGVGKKFGGGTACGSAAPFPGQALTATRKTMSRKANAASAAREGPWSAQGSRRNWGTWWGASSWWGAS